MTDIVGKKLSDGTIAVKSPLAGTEQLYINDAGTSKKTTTQDVADLVDVYPYDVTKDPTGFEATDNNSGISVSYDGTTRKVTLTGTFTAYYHGQLVSVLTNGWVSDAHADVTGSYFLRYNGTGFEFDTTPWYFYCMQIAFVEYDDVSKTGRCIREVHSLMDWRTHQELHKTIGTYLDSGADISGITLNSTTAAERRPDMALANVFDEDLKSIIPALTTKLYTQRYLTGAGGTKTFVTGAADIIPLSTNQPYYNQWTGATWQQTLFGVNDYGAIFVIAAPMGSDTNSQLHRYQFLQPQQVSGTLSVIQGLTPNNVTTGESGVILSEYVFVGKIIVRYTASNWVIISTEKLVGTRTNQSTQAGAFLSTVAVDGSTITGNGTPSSPLAFSKTITVASGDALVLDTSAAVNSVFRIKNETVEKFAAYGLSADNHAYIRATVATGNLIMNLGGATKFTFDYNGKLTMATAPTAESATAYAPLTRNTSTGEILTGGKQVVSIASDTTPNPTGWAYENEYYLTALAGNITEVAAPIGTPVNGNTLMMRIKDDGTARTIAWNAIYKGFSQTLPSTTILGKEMYLGFIYNSASSKWDLLSRVDEV